MDSNDDCGFTWGGVKVTRLAEHKGYRVFGIETPKQRLEVCITPGGRIDVRPVVKKPKTSK